MHKISLTELDDENQTPLHWACLYGKDNAISYLIGMSNRKEI